MKEKLTKNKVSRRDRKIRIFGLMSAVLTVASVAVFVPLIGHSAAENQNLELEIHRLDSDSTKLNNQVKEGGKD